jgi:arsenate reductase
VSAASFNQVVDPILARAISAGTYPAEQVHPVVVEARREVGIDLNTTKTSKAHSGFGARCRDADYDGLRR